jgi:tetratricopeptide (TPR) repeat protein
MKDTDGALADFTQAIRVNPKYSFAYYERGKLLRDAGKTEEAKADLDEATKLNPKLVAAAAAPVAETATPKTTSLVGTWEFGGTIDGAPAWERAVLAADGSISSTIRVRGRDGYWREAVDSGTYSVTGDRLVVRFKTLGVIDARFERTGDNVRITRKDGTARTYALAK